MKTPLLTQDPTTDVLSGDGSDARAAGLAGAAVGGLSVLLLALYFVYSGAPPEWNVLTRGLLTLVIMAALTMFGVALAPLLSAGRPLAGRLALVSLLTYVAVILFATSLEVGTPLAHPGTALDPTTDGPLAAGMAMAHGPIAHIWIAMFLIGFAVAMGGTGRPRLVSRRVIRGGVTVAAINLLAVPSLYFGMDAKNFYAVNGWGADALVGLITLAWIGVIGTAILRGTAQRRLP